MAGINSGRIAQAAGGVAQAAGAINPVLGGVLATSSQNLQSPSQQTQSNGYSGNGQPGTDNSLNHTPTIPPETQGSQDTIPTLDGKSTLPRVLQDPNTISNSIPGVSMTPKQHEQAISSVGSLPLYQQENARAQIEATFASSQALAKEYVDNHGLNPEEKSWMKDVTTSYKQMSQLHDLLDQYGAKDTLEAKYSGQPFLRSLQSSGDKTGNIALMDQLISNLHQYAAQDINQGKIGRYLSALNGISPGRTREENLKVLESVMGQTQDKFNQYAPVYGLTQQTQQEVQNAQSSQPTQQNPLQQIFQAPQLQQPPAGFGRQL